MCAFVSRKAKKKRGNPELTLDLGTADTWSAKDSAQKETEHNKGRKEGREQEKEEKKKGLHGHLRPAGVQPSHPFRCPTLRALQPEKRHHAVSRGC